MSNEITVKIKGDIQEFYKTIEEKGFKQVKTFTLDDTFFIPQSLEIANLTARDILAKAVLVREIQGTYLNQTITFKQKEFDEQGNILSQGKVECEVNNVENAKKLLSAIGFKEIMHIFESDKVYSKDGFELAIKDIENGANLIEVEEDEELDTIEKLKNKINEIDIPIYTDNYFVKKAEIELNKILGREEN